MGSHHAQDLCQVLLRDCVEALSHLPEGSFICSAGWPKLLHGPSQAGSCEPHGHGAGHCCKVKDVRHGDSDWDWGQQEPLRGRLRR